MARVVWMTLVLGTTFLVGCSMVFDMDGFANGASGPTTATLPTTSAEAGTGDARSSTSPPKKDNGETTTPSGGKDAIDASAPPVACRNGTCETAGSICCAKADGTGTCIADDKTACAGARLKCTSRSTCGGFDCCLYDFDPHTGCMYGCSDVPGAHYVCETSTDCPSPTKCTGTRWGIKFCQ
jgi:hypothetical protein